MLEFITRGLVGLAFFVAALPSSTNYKLHNYGVGTGGGGTSTSTNYGVNATLGETSGPRQASTNYENRPANLEAQAANVPTATLSNPANYYKKLKLVIGEEGNPSDTLYAVAISTDDFAADTRYVKSDNTVGTTLVYPTDYRTYASWGGASGINVIGLSSSTTYYVKAKAIQGEYTETQYGPTSSAATVAPQLSFDIDVSASDTETGSPYAVAMGNLNAGAVVDAPSRVWVDLDTNADSGGKVYLYGLNASGGLRSTAANYTIASATADLSSANEGFGARGMSATQSSGGPFSISSPYDGAGNNVGLITTVIREIFSTDSPITAGRGSFLLKAKARTTTPAASDYAETLTLVAAGRF